MWLEDLLYSIDSRAIQLLLSSMLEQSSSSSGPIYVYTSADTLGRIVHLRMRARTDELNVKVRVHGSKEQARGNL